jgi:5'/3'-nucleotidase SurE
VLSLLLTNDDGYAAPGIQSMRRALEAAGHRVTIVAPTEDQTAKGTSITLGGQGAAVFRDGYNRLKLQFDEGYRAWHINGTPSDSVRAALALVFKTRPDLVISGTNLGQNLGPVSTSSGVIGAAIWAIHEGIPAVAVSAGVDFAEAHSDPPFKSSLAAMERTGSIIVGLLARLEASRAEAGSLLPPGTGLSVNVPLQAHPKGPVLTRVGRANSLRIEMLPDHDFAETGNVVARILPNPSSSTLDPTSESDMFSAGYVTITPIDGDWSGDDGEREWLAAVLRVDL